MTEDTLAKGVDALEYTLRLQAAVEEMNKDPLFVEDFVTALGEFMAFAAIQADSINILDKYDVDTLRPDIEA